VAKIAFSKNDEEKGARQKGRKKEPGGREEREKD